MALREKKTGLLQKSLYSIVEYMLDLERQEDRVWRDRERVDVGVVLVTSVSLYWPC
jgi:hypothetical protein